MIPLCQVTGMAKSRRSRSFAERGGRSPARFVATSGGFKISRMARSGGVSQAPRVLVSRPRPVPSGFHRDVPAGLKIWQARWSIPKGYRGSDRPVHEWRPLKAPPSFREGMSPPRRQKVCKRRYVRRAVMFALRVAGLGWAAGGPRMFNALRNVDSGHSC